MLMPHVCSCVRLYSEYTVLGTWWGVLDLLVCWALYVFLEKSTGKFTVFEIQLSRKFQGKLQVILLFVLSSSTFRKLSAAHAPPARLFGALLSHNPP